MGIQGSSAPGEQQNQHTESAIKGVNEELDKAENKEPLPRKATAMEVFILTFFTSFVWPLIGKIFERIDQLIGGGIPGKIPSVIMLFITVITFIKRYPQALFKLKFVDKKGNDMSTIMLLIHPLVTCMFIPNLFTPSLFKFYKSPLSLFISPFNFLGLASKDDPRLLSDKLLGVYTVSIED
ncbi:MAG: hypothetical protein AAF335_04215 [Bacteroidota bacterium]